jgi:O-antigen ligase
MNNANAVDQDTLNSSRKSGQRTSRDLMAMLSAWVICPVIMLFSYMPMLNLVARVPLVGFVFWFGFNALTRTKKAFWPKPLMIYLLWGMYTMLPSVFAPQFDLAINKWVTVVFLGLVNLAVANAVVLSGSIRPWAWAYLVSALLSYISNFLPIQSYIEVDYETEILGRDVGTFGNANAYGRAMVQAALLAMVLLMIEHRNFWRVLIIVFLALFSLAVLGSSSRTALMGLILVFIGGVYSSGFKSVFKLRNIVFFLGTVSAGVVGVGMLPERFANVFERMWILLAYVGLAEKVDTKEQSLEERKDLMNTAWEVWLDHPMGIGLDNYRVVSGVYAHSNYFELLASVGIIGLLIYYLSYFLFFKRLWQRSVIFDMPALKKILMAGIAVMAVMDVSNVSYYSKSLWLLLSILMGQLCLLDIQYKKDRIYS